MAEVNTGGGEAKKGKPKKLNLRVDFTPMVDMNMLLITFFMFCTTLSKPQMMDLVMPIKDNIPITERNKVDEAKTITLLLDKDDIIYYYFGKADYEDYTSLMQTNYSADGLRSIIVGRNGQAVSKMSELRMQKQQKQISEEEFQKQATEIRASKDGLVVVIKPTDAANYANLVDVLDEMQICSIGQYAIVDVTDGDAFMIDNYLQKGALSAEAAKFKDKK